jgi:hypothetical protein
MNEKICCYVPNRAGNVRRCYLYRRFYYGLCDPSPATTAAAASTAATTAAASTAAAAADEDAARFIPAGDQRGTDTPALQPD